MRQQSYNEFEVILPLDAIEEQYTPAGMQQYKNGGSKCCNTKKENNVMHIHVRMHTHTHVRTHIHTHTYVHTHIHTHGDIYMLTRLQNKQ